MYERILVPVDGSETAEAILPFAEKVAGPLDAELVLLHVVADAKGGYVFPNRAEAVKYLDSLADRLANKGIRVRTGLGFGSLPEAILSAADKWNADLIAMATHARSGLSRLVVGSVAEAVLRAARVPVLMMRTAVPALPPAREAALR
jgi:nucleotide-binding universal stress UspA family protein